MSKTKEKNAKAKTKAKPAKQAVPPVGKEVKSASAKVGKAITVAKPVVAGTLDEQFEAIRKALRGTNDSHKDPRTLKRAMNSLFEAQKDARKHIHHSVN